METQSYLRDSPILGEYFGSRSGTFHEYTLVVASTSSFLLFAFIGFLVSGISATLSGAFVLIGVGTFLASLISHVSLFAISTVLKDGFVSVLSHLAMVGVFVGTVVAGIIAYVAVLSAPMVVFWLVSLLLPLVIVEALKPLLVVCYLVYAFGFTGYLINKFERL